MPRKAIWVGDDLWRLLNLPIKELQKLYPQFTRDTLKGKKAYWKKQLREGKIQMPPSPENKGELEPQETRTEYVEDGKLVSEIDGWYEMIARDSDGEVRRHRLYRHSTKKRPLEDSAELLEELEQFRAQRATIRPSRRKFPERDHRLLFLMSDMQIDFRRIIDGKTGEQELVPTHDPTAIKAAQLIAADLQPDEIVNLGDTIDFANISRFPANSDHFFKTMGISFQAVHDMYAQFRADNPHAKITEVDSNHNERFKKYVLKNFPEAYDMYRPGVNEKHPVLSYPYLSNLGILNVDYVSGGQEAEYLYGQDYTEIINGREYPKPPFRMAHGTETGQNGQTVQKIIKNNPETHNAQGHAHSAQYVERVNRLGQRIISMVVPPLCKTTGEVESYHSQVNDLNKTNKYQEAWPQGVALLRDYEGEYIPEFIPIRNGIARYRGKEYNGNAS